MILRRLLKAAAVNLIPTPVVPVLLWCLNPGFPARHLARIFVISAVFSSCIGLCFRVAMGRIWQRSLSMRPWAAWTLRVAGFFGIATVGTVVGSAVLHAIGMVPAGGALKFFYEVYRFALLVTAGVSGVIVLYETMKQRLEATNLELKQKELERERAMKLATEATLASLESRIHPHFLFNTLNSVASLIPEDPARAEKLLGQMSQLLRFSLDSQHSGLVPVEHELKIVEDYLEIEKTRFGGRLRYEIGKGAAKGLVPPLSIQTLVENSIKYAVAPRREGGEIAVHVRPGTGTGIEVEVADSGPGFDAGKIVAGHGLENLELRLKGLFPGHEGLRIGGGRVSFQVPQ